MKKKNSLRFLGVLCGTAVFPNPAGEGDLFFA